MGYLIKSESENRLAAVRKILEEKNLDLALVYYDEFNIGNGWYLTGWCPQFESGAVLVPRVGVVVSAGTADDVEALKALVAKAAVCCLHVRATGASASLSPVNVAIQHHHYVKKYALQKDGEA